jgi:transcriptional regulator with XRE-family HTH domain
MNRIEERDWMVNVVGLDGFVETPETLSYALTIDFAEQVWDELGRRDMTLKDLAKLMDVTPQTVSRMLSGETSLTLRSVAKIAIALGAEVTAPTLDFSVPLEERTLGGSVAFSVNDEDGNGCGTDGDSDEGIEEAEEG